MRNFPCPGLHEPTVGRLHHEPFAETSSFGRMSAKPNSSQLEANMHGCILLAYTIVFKGMCNTEPFSRHSIRVLALDIITSSRIAKY